MSDELEPHGPPDDWPHRHPHLSTVLIALLGALPLGGLFALGGLAGGIIVGAAIAAVVIVMFEGLSLALRFPIAASLLSGTPRSEYRYLGPQGTEAVFTHGDGGGDVGGGGGGDGGGGG